MNIAAKGGNNFEKQPSARVANMEFATNWDNEASVSQNDIEAEKKEELPTRLVPGYATFDDYLQVRLLVRDSLSLDTPPPGHYALYLLNILANKIRK